MRSVTVACLVIRRYWVLDGGFNTISYRILCGGLTTRKPKKLETHLNYLYVAYNYLNVNCLDVSLNNPK